MKLYNDTKSYTCVDMRTGTGRRTFYLTEEPEEMYGIITLAAEEPVIDKPVLEGDEEPVEKPSPVLLTFDAGQYAYQYIRQSGIRWTLEFTNTEYIPPEPPPEPDPTEYEPTASELLDILLGVTNVE